jgi:hypothetical protein
MKKRSFAPQDDHFLLPFALFLQWLHHFPVPLVREHEMQAAKKK